MTELSPELTQKLVTAVESMPAFPKSVQRILELTRDVNSVPKDLVDVIDKDPVVTIKILKVVNSAYYSLPKQITSIGHAVVYLGFNTIKNLALSIAAIGILPKVNAADFNVEEYLLHSLATAGLAKKLASRLQGVDPMDCFIAGLLHDFGKVVFAQFMPAEFRMALIESKEKNLSLHNALQARIGVDHAVVGAMLIERWRFAPELIASIRHQSPLNFNDSPMVACIFGANQIAKHMKFGFGGNSVIEPFPMSVEKRLGGDMQTVISGLGDLTGLFEEAKVFAKL
jgi:putative nucleotidyltransferase with HDIG domain